MIKTKIFLVIISFPIIVINCYGQNKQKGDANSNEKHKEIQVTPIQKNKMEEVLKLQLISGESGLYEETSDGETYEYSEKDLETIVPIQRKKLESSGFKFLNSTEFNYKIKIIFNRIINSQSDSRYLYIYPIKKCERKIFFYRNKYTASANPPSYYIIKNDNFLTELYAIPEIIDYQKEYPNIARIEDTINTHIIKDNFNIELNLWKNEATRQDEYNLAKRRRFNQQLLISRNKYLFNDDKSQFAWLAANDEYFMRNLVTTFGYTEDKKLLKWVIENTDLNFYELRSKKKLDFNEIGNLFWIKDCDSKIRLHSNTFKVLQELYKPNDSSSMRFLLDYMAGYLEYLFDEKNYVGILTEERIRLGANIAYFAEQYKYNPEYKDSERMMGRLRYFTGDDYDGVLKKNNYFGLPKFKEWWDKAEYDRAYVTECEYGGTCGRDNPAPTPDNYKKGY